jgi:tripeptidyl-peptidase-1
MIFTLAVASASADSCGDKYTDQTKCDGDSGCTWCKCAALPSACWTKANAKSLPSGVYQCDSTDEVARVSIESDVDTVQLALEDGWEKLGLAEDGAQIELSFLLKQTNLPELTRTALAVSDPQSERYGQHLTMEQVNQLIAPTQEAVTSVDTFLQEHGVHAVTRTGNSDMVRVTVPVTIAEKMLGAKYYRFLHKATGTTILRTYSYSVPATVSQHLDLVAPTVKFPGMRRSPSEVAKSLKVEVSDPTNRQNTPGSLRKLYNVGAVMGNASANIQSCTAFLGQYFKQSDLTKFWTKYYPKLEALKPVIKVVGPDAGQSGVEAALDIEYITGMGANVPTQFWYVTHSFS